jgi:Fic family protein
MTSWDANRPNNGLKSLPPEGFVLSAKHQELLLEVAELLGRLDEAADLLANPAVFNNALPMLEVAASSRIENIITTHDQMFVADVSATQPISRDTRLAMRNRAALSLGFEALSKRPLSVPLLVEIASELLGYRVDLRNLPGTFIGSEDQRVYTPPEGKQLLERLLNDLVSFIGDSDLHVVLVMIFAHYQFEGIHPFPDGNGRTGRVLNHLILKSGGVLRSPVLNLSSYLVKHRDEYYRRLHGVEATSDWNGWVEFMLEAMRTSIADSYSKLKALTLAQLNMSERTHDVAGKFGSELVQLLFEKPYCQIGHVVDRLGVSRPTASKLLEGLVASGELTSFVSGKEKFFVNSKMLEVLAK